MNKFIKVHPKANLKIYILIGIIQAISLTKLIISIINYSNISNKINHFEENDPDIIITGLSSIQFLEKKNPEEYNVSEPNLGSTGKIILDCFSGECIFRELTTCYKTVCKKTSKKNHHEKLRNMNVIKIFLNLFMNVQMNAELKGNFHVILVQILQGVKKVVVQEMKMMIMIIKKVA